ncbi:MAG: hypothetical protein IAE82_08125 [Opitutaceae bacterium]|nr:hypothetical protein [Opitutaceae bacterium]
MTRAESRLFARILANDLRLYFRAWDKRKRGMAFTLLIQALIVGFLHLQLPALFAEIARSGNARGGAGLACAFVLLFTLMAGLHRSLEVLYNRGDLPYLLSSPVPSRLVILSRLADVLATTAFTTLFVVLPMLNCAVYLFGPHWLWGWPAWITAVALVSTLALVMTIRLVTWIGARGARTLVQVLGILVGSAAILAMQVPNWLERLNRQGEQTERIQRYFAAFETPPLPQLAAAASGAWIPLLTLAIAGAAAVWLTLRVLEREFVSGAQRAAEDAGGRTSPGSGDPAVLARAWRQSFRGGRWSALVRKELRTLRRDPLLIARSSTQLISFLPAIIGMAFLPRVAAVGILGVLLPAMTAVTTASLMSAFDESLEIVCASPVSRVRAMWARTTAAALPSALLGWIGAGVLLGFGAPHVAWLTGALATFLALALAWLGGCTTPRLSAEDRAANRPARAAWQVFIAMLVSGVGSAAVATQAMGASWLVAVPLAAITLVGGGLMFVAQPRPIWAD